MLVGEASGEHEQREGLPFRPGAPAGGVLTRILRNMGLDRAQFSITNVIRCRPRNNFLEGAPWEYQALMHCRPNLERAILERKPRCIVALGGTAMRELTGMTGAAQGIGHLAGYVLPCRTYSMLSPIPVIGNFHPAYLRRGKASHQGIFARILKRATNIAAGRDHDWLWGDPEDHAHALNYQTHPSPADVESYSHYVLGNPELVVSYDLETGESASIDEDAREGFADTHIRLVQFAVEGRGAIAIPWEPQFVPCIAAILRSPNTKCGHNVWLFDNKVLRAAGQREGIDLTPRGTTHDTLAMFHHWQPDLPAHLQAAASFVQFPFPWKHYGTDDATLPFYGCCDVDATLRLYTMLEKTLKRDGVWDDTGYATVTA
jgi:uracil-DNA glycosylase family 4